MEDVKKYFSKKDLDHVETIVKISLQDVNTDGLTDKEMKSIIEMLEAVTLHDLYVRRYKNS